MLLRSPREAPAGVRAPGSRGRRASAASSTHGLDVARGRWRSPPGPAGGPWPGTTRAGSSAARRSRIASQFSGGKPRVRFRWRVDADEVAGEEHALGGDPDDRVAGGVAAPHSIATASPRSRSPANVSVGGVSSRSGRRRRSPALLLLRLRRALLLELVEVGLHLLLQVGDAAGADLADRLRGLLGGEDREVGERLRAAVVVEVGVRDEQALDAARLRRGGRGPRRREAAVDDRASRRCRRCRRRRRSSIATAAQALGADLLEAVVHVSAVLQRADVALERRRAFLGDLDRARADDDPVGELGGGARRAPGVEIPKPA